MADKPFGADETRLIRILLRQLDQVEEEEIILPIGFNREHEGEEEDE